MKSRRELEFLDKQMVEIVLMQNSLEEKKRMVAMLDAEVLTKDLVDELIERIDVYRDDRGEMLLDIVGFDLITINYSKILRLYVTIKNKKEILM